MSHNLLKITPGKPILLRRGLAIACSIRPFRTEKNSIASRSNHVSLPIKIRFRKLAKAADNNEVQKR